MNTKYLDLFIESELQFMSEETRIIELNDIAKRMRSNGDIQNWFVRFVQAGQTERFGMNYSSLRPHSDPPGIYAYPLDWFTQDKVNTEDYYATDLGSCYVFRIDLSQREILVCSQLLDKREATTNLIHRIVESIRLIAGRSASEAFKVGIDAVSKNKQYNDSLLNFFNIITNNLGLRPVTVFNIFTNAGIHAIYDDTGNGIINRAEPYQIVIFDRNMVEKLQKVSLKKEPNYRHIAHQIKVSKPENDYTKILSNILNSPKLGVSHVRRYLAVIAKRYYDGVKPEYSRRQVYYLLRKLISMKKLDLLFQANRLGYPDRSVIPNDVGTIVDINSFVDRLLDFHDVSLYQPVNQIFTPYVMKMIVNFGSESTISKTKVLLNYEEAYDDTTYSEFLDLLQAQEQEQSQAREVARLNSRYANLVPSSRAYISEYD